MTKNVGTINSFVIAITLALYGCSEQISELVTKKREVLTRGVTVPDECERVAVKDEVFYRQMAATNIRKQFEIGEIYLQGVERCKETIFIYYQIDRQSQFVPTSQVMIDIKTLAVTVEPGE